MYISLNRKIRFEYYPRLAFKFIVIYTFKFVQSLFYNYSVVQFSSNSSYTETRIDVLIYTNINLELIRLNHHNNNTTFATEEDHNGILQLQ